jgi:hypothetical protein
MRTRVVMLACTAIFVMTLGWVLSAADDKDGQNNNKAERARIAQGFAIAPAFRAI